MKIVAISPEALTVQADTLPEASDALDCLNGIKANMDPAGYLAAMSKGLPLTVSKSAGKKHLDNGGGFERVRVQVTDYFTPYVELLKKRTGSDLAPMRVESVEGIYHTHICERAEWDGKDLWADVVLMVYPPTNVKPCDEFAKHRPNRAKQNATRYIQDKLGRYIPEPEFIPTSHGLYKRNPNFGRGPCKTQACVNNDATWREVWFSWVQNQATEEQKALAARCHKVFNEPPAPSATNDYGCMYLDNCHASVSWEEFSKGTGIQVLKIG